MQKVEEFTTDLNGEAGAYLDRHFANWKTNGLVAVPAFVMSPHPEPTTKEGEVGAVRGFYGEAEFHSWITEMFSHNGEQAATFNGIKLSKGRNNSKPETLAIFEQTIGGSLDFESKFICDGGEMKSLKDITSKGPIEIEDEIVVTRNFGVLIAECKANLINQEKKHNKLNKIYEKQERQLKRANDIMRALFAGAGIQLEGRHVTAIQALTNWDGDVKPDFVDSDGVQHRVMNRLRLQMSSEFEKILTKNEEWISHANYEKIVKGLLIMNLTKQIPNRERHFEMKYYGAHKQQIDKLQRDTETFSKVCYLLQFIQNYLLNFYFYSFNTKLLCFFEGESVKLEFNA